MPAPDAWQFEAIGTAWQIDTGQPLPEDVIADVLGCIKRFDKAWSRFRDPNNRLQTQLLFVLASAAAADPDADIPALNHDLDVFAAALTHFGVAEGLAPDTAAREARLIVSTLLGLYLDFYISRGSDRVDESFVALLDWVRRSSAG